jgi:hypothetical protein
LSWAAATAALIRYSEIGLAFSSELCKVHESEAAYLAILEPGPGGRSSVLPAVDGTGLGRSDSDDCKRHIVYCQFLRQHRIFQ